MSTLPEVTLFCWVPGDKHSFPIKINPEETVGSLKAAIAAVDTARFQPAYNLELYLVDIPNTKAAKQSFVLKDLKDDHMLDESDEIKDHFQGDPPRKMIHIAITLPGS